MLIIEYNYGHQYKNIMMAVKIAPNIKREWLCYKSYSLVIEGFFIMYSMFIGLREKDQR